MRQRVTVPILQKFMKQLAAAARNPSRVFLVGGASAVLLGWRDATIDIDLKIVPENDEILRSLPQLKESLQVNVELASPDDFIPELPGWQDRSSFIAQEGKLSFFHYDFYAQALAKIERGHLTDVSDVNHLISRGLVEVGRLIELFDRIEDQIYRYPALNSKNFRDAVERVVRQSTNTGNAD